jgi:hypothetical protein
MKSYYKTLFSKEYHAGTPISVLAANYGFSVQEIEKAILPKKAATTIAVKERTYAPADILKKVKQKQAGKKAAETRKRNKEAAIAKLPDRISKFKSIVQAKQDHPSLAKNEQIASLVRTIVGNVQSLLQLID